MLMIFRQNVMFRLHQITRLIRSIILFIAIHLTKQLLNHYTAFLIFLRSTRCFYVILILFFAMIFTRQ